MGAPIRVFRLYEVTEAPDFEHRHLLLCLVQGEFSNANYNDELCAQNQLEEDGISLLKALGLDVSQCLLLGELQESPIGEELYDLKGPIELGIWFAETEGGPPWIVLGTSDSEAEFWDEIQEHADLFYSRPRRPAKHVLAYCVELRRPK